ncbi:MAG: flagellar FliJ family protein [Rhodospirillales bacterium]|nr:flagellar FliJ family protein [Rhodospirillales bacterium]
MANLSSLIRLRKHTVDQKQKFLADLYRQVDALTAEKTSLNEQVAAERHQLEEQGVLEALAWFGRYAAGVKLKIELIDRDIQALEERIDIARADLRNAFSELKKIEITDRRRREEERKKEQTKESRALDEIGIEGHRRGKLQEQE